MKNKLYFGDNLHVLRQYVKDESIDLVYLDPPFNSNANYNVLFKAPSGIGSQAQVEAFRDTWHWGPEAEEAYEDVKESRTPAAGIVRALRSFLGENDMMAYLVMMAVRLIEMHRVLKTTGSLYLHCDPTASHYLKLLLDGIFGPTHFINELIWKRYGAHNDSRTYGRVHDIILFYSKSDEFTFNKQHEPYSADYIKERFRFSDPDGRRWAEQNLASPNPRPNLTYPFLAKNGVTYDPPANGWKYTIERMRELDDANGLHYPARTGGRLRLKNYFDKRLGIPVQDVWSNLTSIGGTSPERLGYPTQKPVTLLERIIAASSNRGDVVLDPFCGCGTALHAAQRLGRQWIGIDITHIAIQIIVDRLKRYFPAENPAVIGRPEDIEGARALAQRDKYQFQWWATSLVKGQPRGGERKGADRGIDGEIFFKLNRREDGRAIISVKGGANLNPSMVRDLVGTRISETADMALLITLAQPTAEMITAAAKDGFIGDPDSRVPRTQILTIEQLLTGLQFRTPAGAVYDTAAVPAQADRITRKRKPKGPTPEQLRRQPEFPPMPLPGGKNDKQQPSLELDEPLLTSPQSTRSIRRKVG